MLSFNTRIAAPLAALLFGACATDTMDADVETNDSPVETATSDSAPNVLAQATASSGRAHNTEIKYTDPNIKCYKLTGFASASNKAAKYNVPAGARDMYVAFNMRAPWTGTQYVKSFKSIIDNSKVLHHWLLFRQLGQTAEGVVPNALGAHPDGEMLYGWAPGGDNMWLDEDVGFEVPGGSVFQLEMHYNNTGAAAQDASGVELCVTPTKPKHIAGLSWVGTDAINGTTATGTCTHSSRSPIQLIASQPHMHVKGINMRAELRRANGQSEVIHDQPFDFDYQRAYIHDVTINPGDKIITTCRFSGPARFGKGTNDEMCYFFSIHYPAGALARRSLGSIIHGPNTCID